jgi:hypothetical protein
MRSFRLSYTAWSVLGNAYFCRSSFQPQSSLADFQPCLRFQACLLYLPRLVRVTIECIAAHGVKSMYMYLSATGRSMTYGLHAVSSSEEAFGYEVERNDQSIATPRYTGMTTCIPYHPPNVLPLVDFISTVNGDHQLDWSCQELLDSSGAIAQESSKYIAIDYRQTSDRVKSMCTPTAITV